MSFNQKWASFYLFSLPMSSLSPVCELRSVGAAVVHFFFHPKFGCMFFFVELIIYQNVTLTHQLKLEGCARSITVTQKKITESGFPAFPKDQLIKYIFTEILIVIVICVMAVCVLKNRGSDKACWWALRRQFQFLCCKNFVFLACRFPIWLGSFLFTSIEFQFCLSLKLFLACLHVCCVSIGWETGRSITS